MLLVRLLNKSMLLWQVFCSTIGTTPDEYWDGIDDKESDDWGYTSNDWFSVNRFY